VRALAAAGLMLAPWVACSSKSSNAPKCDPAQCGPGNDCIDDGSGSGPSCHLVCTEQSCPVGYYCNDGRPKSWCVENTLQFTPADGGVGDWGSPCSPTKGEGHNPACDLNNAFGCYGISPTDANAFCTQFGCLGDSDCPGGWWCATVNDAPNVTTTNVTFGKTRAVCLPRAYCAPCQLDHDCAPTADGLAQYCIADNQGNGYCTPRCSTSANCNGDAACNPHWRVCLPGNAAQPCARDEDCPLSAQDFAQHCDFGAIAADAGSGPTMGVCAPECGSDADCAGQDQHCQNSNTAYCTPRAGVCKGDGTLCSPCRSDADCTGGGFCLLEEYSGERFCSQAAKGTCSASGACPSKTGAPGSQVACTTMASSFAPVNQCVGLVQLGGMPIPGCWTASR